MIIVAEPIATIVIDKPKCRTPIRNPYMHQSTTTFMNYEQSMPLVIYWLRNRLGMSQRAMANDVAKITDKDTVTSRVWISKIENGNCMPNIESMEKIASVLGTTLAAMTRMCEVLMDRE